MSRIPKSALGPLTILAAVPLALGTAGPAAAAPAQHSSFTGTDTVCGIDVTVSSSSVFKEIDRPGGVYLLLQSGRTTLTSEATGKSVTVSAGGPTLETDTLNSDGTTTITLVYRGLPEKVRGSSGVLTRDAGRLLETVVLDASGNPISDELQVLAGPHPEADSGFTTFCDVVTSALS